MDTKQDVVPPTSGGEPLQSASPAGVLCPAEGLLGVENGVHQSGHHEQRIMPRCQVLGCEADLSSLPGYWQRHRVCVPHSRDAGLEVAGVLQRWCQVRVL